MNTSLTKKELTVYLVKQINNFFPDREVKADELLNFVSIALEKATHSFSRIKVRYYRRDNSPYFNHLNTDQYAMFLYFVSNTIWKEGKNAELASKCYGLNKALHSLDAYYEINLPDIFCLIHPIGTVLGRGEYSDYFVAYQGVTVGQSPNGDHPVIGAEVVLYANSSVLGKSVISANSIVSTGTTIIDTEIPENALIFGSYPSVQHKPTKISVKERFFI